MEVGKVCYRYCVNGVTLKKNSLYFKTLPGDEVEYDPLSMLICRILTRPKNITIGKVENNSLILPLMSSTFKERLEVEDGWYTVSLPELKIGKMRNLYKAISQIYLKTALGTSYPLESSREHHYTKPFRDLRHLETFNVDPVDSTDFDDAISVESDGKSVCKIYTHIVDIDHYVIPRSLEDVRAFGLGMTLYNPEGVIHATSGVEGYSLKMGVPRRVITVEFDIVDDKIVSYEIYKSEIVIKRRYTYESFVPSGPLLDFVRANMRTNVLDIPHLKLVVEDGSVKDHKLEWSSDFNHRIIETLMIMTNITIAAHLKKRGVKFPSRHHPRKRFSTERCEHEHRIVATYIELKNFSKACYSVEFSGHIGLDLDQYTHFTSPLRRYPDVMVHRILAGYSYPEMDRMIDYLNRREKLIDDMTFYYMNEMKKTIPRDENRIRYIVKVTGSGVLVLDPEIMLEEYIHVSNLKPYCIYVFEVGILKGDEVEYRLGDIYKYR